MADDVRAGVRTDGVENTWDAISNLLRPIAVEGDAGAVEVGSAFYDVRWVPEGSPWTDYFEVDDLTGCFTLSWRGAGSYVAELRGRGEHYMDWCPELASETVSDRVRAAMASLGLRPVT